MKRFFAFIVLVKLLLVLFIGYSYAAKGVASVYKVTMRKVELCTSSSSVSNCEGAVVIGHGDKEVDIAAVDAGAAAASYGTATMLELGVTYSHLRVTINRQFKIKGNVDSGSDGDEDTDNCNTIVKTDTMYGGAGESDRKFTHVPVWSEAGTLAESNLYMPNDDYSRCLNATCASTNDDIDMTYGTAYATYQEQHAEGDLTDDHMLVYKLTSPYTVSMQPPTIDIKFGTQEALGVYEVNNLCQMWAEEPVVSITIK